MGINVTYSLTIHGPIPAKKNRWHRGKGGRMYYDRPEVAGQIESITHQLAVLWRRDPISGATVDIIFYCKDRRGDLDNMLTTLLDCMKTAGVIVDDNLLHLPGPVTYRGVKDAEARTSIVITEKTRSAE